MLKSKASFANRIFALVLALTLGMASFLLWSVGTHAEDDVPAYSGSPSVALNNNVPGFTDKEITTSSFEKYGELDQLGRCTAATACIGQELMPTEERQSIVAVKPTGWKQNKYPGVVDSKPPYLFNRCHLIGFQLTGENANEKNLITGTRYMNVEGMLPYENEVADYVSSTGNHVMYRVTPIFTGNNLLCDGVQIEAYSVEDKGKEISFNVFCYNVQPGIEINYADGSNELAPDAGKIADSNSFIITGGDSGNGSVRSSAGSDDPGIPAGTTYVVNKNSGKFHYPSCDSVNDMKEKNKEYSTKTRDELISEGKTPCKRCNP
ncbi:DNA-entry nuclease [Butyrivibrio proteoclasticus]|uniref:DNA-entry nuclease n=1 Tax=Butyrivibrio proteoclasticus TaxID=43305 RepID=A0A1I5S5Z5_9FIRM|nr:DNA/RNA non-specific endonuclease [Butyrivibrio proteoclasticus]SFP66198.1 DNA-entry nuclease [Butyrivibrio proteoclasticus]